uniref:Uncharacterized protein n=1 Tax=viral metagenome TaxID=1070528 RepID=A0A6C0J5P1_9ZZZZ
MNTQLTEKIFQDSLKESGIPWNSYRYNGHIVNSLFKVTEGKYMNESYDINDDAPDYEDYNPPTIRFTEQSDIDIQKQYKVACKKQYRLDCLKTETEYQSFYLYLRLENPPPKYVEYHSSDSEDTDEEDYRVDNNYRKLKSILKPLLLTHGIRCSFEEMNDTDTLWYIRPK